jgi:mRNA-decapping enzyme 1B
MQLDDLIIFTERRARVPLIAQTLRESRDMAPRTVKPKGSGASPVPSSSDDVNLKVLRNDDPNIERIVAQSKHAVLYGFDPASRQWARKNVEGSLFVVKRATAPFDAFVVLNRCAAENLTVEIGGEAFELERSPPYLMYRVGRDVNGIWFHDQDECEHMCGVFERVLSGATDARGSANGVAADALKQLFAKASIDGAAPPAPSSSSSPPVRVLQAPRNVVGTSAGSGRLNPAKSNAAAKLSSTPSEKNKKSVTASAVKAALLELIDDDAFINRLTETIERHNA